MKEIQLTQGKVAIVDDEDYEMLMEYKWFAHKNPKSNCYYANANSKNVEGSTSKNGRSIVAMHRVVLGLTIKDNIQVDHKNLNGLDNRRSNLRFSSHRQNQRNKMGIKNTTSKYKGVCWSKGKEKWRSQLTVKDKQIFLGYHIDETAAAEAYNKAALENFGEFAYINNINE